MCLIMIDGLHVNESIAPATDATTRGDTMPTGSVALARGLAIVPNSISKRGRWPVCRSCLSG